MRLRVLGARARAGWVYTALAGACGRVASRPKALRTWKQVPGWALMEAHPPTPRLKGAWGVWRGVPGLKRVLMGGRGGARSRFNDHRGGVGGVGLSLYQPSRQGDSSVWGLFWGGGGLGPPRLCSEGGLSRVTSGRERRV